MKHFKMRHFYKLIIIASCALTACSDRQETSEPAEVIIKPRNTEGLNYEVQAGDTVGSIAVQHNMTRAELIKMNQLTPPYELYEGQKLIVKNAKAVQYVKNDTPKIELVQEGGMKTEYTTNSNTNSINNTSNINNSDAVENKPVEEFKFVDEETSNKENDIPSSKYIWPIENAKSRISQHYSNQNEYILIKAPGGTPVKAISDGEVRFAGRPQKEDLVSYGTMVAIRHDNTMSVYAKLANTNVKVGQKVKCGDKIGVIGNKAQLYFEMQSIIPGQKKRPAVNPETLLP